MNVNEEILENWLCEGYNIRKRKYHLPDDVETITIEMIHGLIKNKISEDAFIDYKGRKIPKKVTDVICSFLNNLGGHIVFGVIEKNKKPIKIVGIERSEMIVLRGRIRTNIRPPMDISASFREIPWNENRIIVVLHLQRIPGKYYESQGKFYYRVGDDSVPFFGEEIKKCKNNHPEKSDLYFQLHEKIQNKPELANILQGNPSTEFITENEVELISDLLPKLLPGITHRIPKLEKYQQDQIPRLSILEKYINKLDQSIALTDVQKYLTSDWKWQRLFFMAGNYCALFDDFERAIIFYESLDGVEPLPVDQDVFAFSHYLHFHNKGVVYYKLKELEKALNSFNEAFDLRPEAYLILNNIGIIYGSMKKEKIAIQYLEKALSHDSYNILVLSNLGIAYKKLGNWKKAIEIFDLILKLEPDNVEILNTKAATLIDQNEIPKSIRLIKRVFQIDPNHVDAMINKAKILQIQGKSEEGIELLDRALELIPDYGKAWHNKGSHLGDSGNYTEALECYKKAIYYDSSLAEPFINMISIYIELKQYNAAQNTLERGLLLFPERWEFYNNKIALQIELKQFKEAEEPLKMAFKKFGDLAQLYQIKCRLLIENRDFKAALVAINRSIKLDKEDANSWYLKSRLHSRIPTLYYKFKTFWSLSKALDIDPNHKSALKFKKELFKNSPLKRFIISEA